MKVNSIMMTTWLIVHLLVQTVCRYILHVQHSQHASSSWSTCTQELFQTQHQPLNKFLVGIPGMALIEAQKPLKLHSAGKLMELTMSGQ